MQIGGERPPITAAEKLRQKALEAGDEEAVSKANAELVAAMLDCQYGNVALNAETSEITIRVLQFCVTCLRTITIQTSLQ